VAVVGAGLAGSLLAWRLASAGPGAGRRIDVFTGDGRRIDVFTGDGRPDATAASGGLVRGFEPDPVAGRLAAAGMAELTASPTLRRWAQYRQIGSVYVCPGADGLEHRVDRLNAVLPGSATLRPVEQLGGDWAGLPAGAYALVESTAGYIRPDALRRGALAEAKRRGARLIGATVAGIGRAPGAAHRLSWAGGGSTYDIVIVAAGAGTGELLRRAGLPPVGLRTKLVQYGLYRRAGPPPPAFVDDTSGLYGRAGAADTVLLGVPSDVWDQPPHRVRPLPQLQRRAEQLAAERFPRLRLGPAVHVRAAADCYGPPGHVALRPVPGRPRLHTFTAGCGGSAKLALAASAAAAHELEESLSSIGVHT
jgi:glycine/D-amino acid oxidase-like deaminating enzyme